MPDRVFFAGLGLQAMGSSLVFCFGTDRDETMLGAQLGTLSVIFAATHPRSPVVKAAPWLLSLLGVAMLAFVNPELTLVSVGQCLCSVAVFCFAAWGWSVIGPLMVTMKQVEALERQKIAIMLPDEWLDDGFRGQLEADADILAELEMQRSLADLDEERDA